MKPVPYIEAKDVINNFEQKGFYLLPIAKLTLHKLIEECVERITENYEYIIEHPIKNNKVKIKTKIENKIGNTPTLRDW